MERDKKECILSAACRAFARFGFKKTSVEEIAKDAGVAKGTVYLAGRHQGGPLLSGGAPRGARLDRRDRQAHRSAQAGRPAAGRDALARACKYLERAAARARPASSATIMILPEWADRLDELRALGRANCAEIVRLGVTPGRVPRGSRRRRGVADPPGHGHRDPPVPRPRRRQGGAAAQAPGRRASTC